MPIYDYKCSNCEHQIEVIQKISEKPKVTCPECNKKTLKKLISAPSFRLKGGGWYETDFKTGKKKNISSNESSKDDKSKESLKTNPKKAPKQDKIINYVIFKATITYLKRSSTRGRSCQSSINAACGDDSQSRFRNIHMASIGTKGSKKS